MHASENDNESFEERRFVPLTAKEAE